jgi:V8-like Glu-specific endopeptidase
MAEQASTNGKSPRARKRSTLTAKRAMTAVRRALHHVRFQSSDGFESLASGVDAGRLGSAQIEELAKLIESAPYDPLTLGLAAAAEEEARSKRARLVGDAKSALDVLAAKGAKKALTAEQADALEAIVRLTGRPAILLQDDRPSQIPKSWEPRIYPLLDDIAKTARAVGRIQPEGQEYIGTGFLVAPLTIMTNRHVAKDLCDGEGRIWKLRKGSKIDFCEEFGSTRKAVFSIENLLGVHPTLDLALLEVKERGTAGARLAPPLKLTDDESKATDGSQVYIVGYPAADDRNNARQQHRIFKGIYEKKRLAPGRIVKCNGKKKMFTHDCTTLGGNSGSCVVEFDTGRVVGLHFSGDYLRENSAVLLPNLRQDPLLAKLHVLFVQERRGA